MGKIALDDVNCKMSDLFGQLDVYQPNKIVVINSDNVFNFREFFVEQAQARGLPYTVTFSGTYHTVLDKKDDSLQRLAVCKLSNSKRSTAIEDGYRESSRNGNFEIKPFVLYGRREEIEQAGGVCITGINENDRFEWHPQQVE